MNRWELKKEISLGDVIAIIFAISSVLLAYGRLDTRLATIEAALIVQDRKDKAQDEANSETKQDLYRWLSRVEDKLDRVIERK